MNTLRLLLILSLFISSIYGRGLFLTIGYLNQLQWAFKINQYDLSSGKVIDPPIFNETSVVVNPFERSLSQLYQGNTLFVPLKDSILVIDLAENLIKQSIPLSFSPAIFDYNSVENQFYIISESNKTVNASIWTLDPSALQIQQVAQLPQGIPQSRVFDESCFDAKSGNLVALNAILGMYAIQIIQTSTWQQTLVPYPANINGMYAMHSIGPGLVSFLCRDANSSYATATFDLSTNRVSDPIAIQPTSYFANQTLSQITWDDDKSIMYILLAAQTGFTYQILTVDAIHNQIVNALPLVMPGSSSYETVWQLFMM